MSAIVPSVTWDLLGGIELNRQGLGLWTEALSLLGKQATIPTALGISFLKCHILG